MPFLRLKTSQKNGSRNGKQRYKCHTCGRQFKGGKRLNPQELWHAYTAGKQTASQLAATFKCSSKTIYRHLKKAEPKAQFATPQCGNIIMDTIYFKRCFGIMVLMDSISGKALFVSEVKHETNELLRPSHRQPENQGHSNPKHNL